jgi:hypothetical protein
MDERWLTRTERRALSKERSRKRQAERRKGRIACDESYAMRYAVSLKAAAERRKARMASDPEYAAIAREKDRIHRKLRREHDPGYDAMIRLRKRLSKVLAGEKKSASCRKLVGCSPSELQAHLESRFAPGMSWENRHLWHIDHIRPCASFDLTDPDQQAQCFHYSNLQPLWALDNIRKGAGAC